MNNQFQSQPESYYQDRSNNQTNGVNTVLNSQPQNKKKKHIALWVFLGVLTVLILISAYLLMSAFALFPPRDLGVRYDESDYVTALEKAKIQIYFDKIRGRELGEYLDSYDDDYLDLRDYRIDADELAYNKLTLNSSELTALIGNVASNILRFENFQFKVREDGSIACSGVVHIDELIEQFQNKNSDINLRILPDKVNFYLAGSIAVKDGKSDLELNELKIGVISILPFADFGGICNDLEDELDRVFAESEAKIINLSTQSDEIVIEAIYPQHFNIERR